MRLCHENQDSRVRSLDRAAYTLFLRSGILRTEMTTAEPASTYVDGLLEMADFKPKDRKCRIDPAFGVSVMCSFGEEHENAVYALLRRPVRVHGFATLRPDTGRIESIEIAGIEPLPSLEGNFFTAPTIHQLAAAQGIGPLRSVESLAGGIAEDEDLDEFLSEIYAARADS